MIVGFLQLFQSTLINSNQSTPRLCNGYPCRYQSSSEYSRLMTVSSSNPICVQLFQQQYCDHALYYIFSFSRYQGDPVVSVAVKPFAANFVILLIAVFVLITILVLVIIVFLYRNEYFQVQDPLERSFLSCSIRNVLFRTFHDHHLRLLLPMAFFVGLEQGFFIADFNKVMKKL